AMLVYLDNFQSVAPGSEPPGAARRFLAQAPQLQRQVPTGINENYGRELLELHTLGVDGGYTQQDVEALARILTGWTIARLNDPDPGTFRFAPAIHEPGPKVLLGKTYREAGIEEGEAALRDLARHPATARHIAAKLACHFIADAPPPGVVALLAKTFRDSDGDLRQVMIALAGAEEAWREPFAKLRNPTELVIAACRAADLRSVPDEALVASLRTLDQPAFVAPSPAGWPDRADAWISPESVLRRAQWCQTFAERLPEPPDPVEIATASFGDLLPAETLDAIRHAPSRRAGLALLLASPEFQRR
ncbi:MAG: DUF1800 domain-containing protein, partial [Alphaproteobacteria bacterium]|nr:DUF1800 domain-containing protein [Alphaproteobacteria bacterium]